MSMSSRYRPSLVMYYPLSHVFSLNARPGQGRSMATDFGFDAPHGAKIGGDFVSSFGRSSFKMFQWCLFIVSLFPKMNVMILLHSMYRCAFSFSLAFILYSSLCHRASLLLMSTWSDAEKSAREEFKFLGLNSRNQNLVVILFAVLIHGFQGVSLCVCVSLLGTTFERSE